MAKQFNEMSPREMLEHLEKIQYLNKLLLQKLQFCRLEYMLEYPLEVEANHMVVIQHAEDEVRRGL